MKKSQILSGLAGILLSTSVAVAKSGDIYTVQSGDSYSSIAQREIASSPEDYFGINSYSLALKLEKSHGTPAERLKIGEKIVIPEVEKIVPQQKFEVSDCQLLAKTLYAEAGNQSKNPEVVREIARLINTRIKRPDFPHTLKEVIFQEKAFECVGGKEWTKVEKKTLTEEEFKIYCEYYKIAEEILSEDLRTENIMYHDDSIPKPDSWTNVTFNKEIGNILFYKK